MSHDFTRPTCNGNNEKECALWTNLCVEGNAIHFQDQNGYGYPVNS